MTTCSGESGCSRTRKEANFGCHCNTAMPNVPAQLLSELATAQSNRFWKFEKRQQLSAPRTWGTASTGRRWLRLVATLLQRCPRSLRSQTTRCSGSAIHTSPLTRWRLQADGRQLLKALPLRTLLLRCRTPLPRPQATPLTIPRVLDQHPPAPMLLPSLQLLLPAQAAVPGRLVRHALLPGRPLLPPRPLLLVILRRLQFVLQRPPAWLLAELQPLAARQQQRQQRQRRQLPQPLSGGRAWPPPCWAALLPLSWLPRLPTVNDLFSES